MSRIGKTPIAIPKGVKAAIEAGTLKVEGPLGKLEHRMHPAVTVAIDPPVEFAGKRRLRAKSTKSL